MKLYELFSETGFHTSIVTSFGVDFDAYENVVLGRMRSAGCHNNLLLVDGNMLGLALETASTPPRYAGRRYTVTGAATTRLFHPKIILQLGRTKGRLVISSANMTAAGLAGHLEVAGIVETDGQPSGETSLFAAAWGFVSRFIDREISSARQQVDWMLARTPWLTTATTMPGPVTLKDGTTAMFLDSGEPFGIARGFVETLQHNQIRRLVVFSPYWDADLTALRFLATSLAARSTVILLDNGKHQFPAGAFKKSATIELRDYKPRDHNRFVHAKAYIAQTPDADHVLYGSANCTAAALGREAYAGNNEEAASIAVCLPAMPSRHLSWVRYCRHRASIVLTIKTLKFPSLCRCKILPPAILVGSNVTSARCCGGRQQRRLPMPPSNLLRPMGHLARVSSCPFLQRKPVSVASPFRIRSTDPPSPDCAIPTAHSPRPRSSRCSMCCAMS